MQAQNIENFLIVNQKYLPASRMGYLKNRLSEMDEQRLDRLFVVDFKDPLMVLLISLSGGTFGIDRFVIGDTGIGVLKLLTLGCCGIFTIVDWFLIYNKTKERNFENLMSLL